jgi:hypothetical protein
LFHIRFLFFTATISNVRRFPFMPILSRKGLLAIAAVVDVALQKDGQPIAAKILAARHVPGVHNARGKAARVSALSSRGPLSFLLRSSPSNSCGVSQTANNPSHNKV